MAVCFKYGIWARHGLGARSEFMYVTSETKGGNVKTQEMVWAKNRIRFVPILDPCGL